jgi:hypothetical protein
MRSMRVLVVGGGIGGLSAARPYPQPTPDSPNERGVPWRFWTRSADLMFQLKCVISDCLVAPRMGGGSFVP